jgi:hypothetical protein
MAQRLYVQIAFADNGGITISGPVIQGGRTDTGKLYISESLDPEKIGAMFLAFYADNKVSGKIDLDNIEF